MKIEKIIERINKIGLMILFPSFVYFSFVKLNDWINPMETERSIFDPFFIGSVAGLILSGCISILFIIFRDKEDFEFQCEECGKIFVDEMLNNEWYDRILCLGCRKKEDKKRIEGK